MHKEMPLCKRFHKMQQCMQMHEKKSTNKLEEVAVQEADFGTMESGDDEDQLAVLSDLEPLSSSCDESDGNESEAAHTLCNCKGSCQRGCPCKSAKNSCTDDCRCAISKCKQRGSMHNIIQRRHPTPAAQRDMASEQEKRCHNHPLFENHILTEHNLELAMRNNRDHLNFPLIQATMPAGVIQLTGNISCGCGAILGGEIEK
ncbi:uncharacterized protein LOC135687196 [Rhopilema esculentum]|uniref:uncharacterized protein LOC135687196 n=1 Tax=Rhopilema esculentum TaxID=499914 RepID=UPI0031CDBD08